MEFQVPDYANEESQLVMLNKRQHVVSLQTLTLKFTLVDRKNTYLQKSQPILSQKMVDNKYDVELVVVEGIELVGYLLYKCLL